MIIRDLFKYFSAFVPTAVLSDSFQVSEGTAYDAFKTELLAVGNTRRIAAIKSFIFGIDAEAVRQKISSVAGVYLFVDYSTVTSTVDETVDRKDDKLHVAVTVAEPQPHDRDQVATALSQDDTLAILNSIRRTMRIDDETYRWLIFPNTVQPFQEKALANSLGWTMEFDVQGVDIV